MSQYGYLSNIRHFGNGNEDWRGSYPVSIVYGQGWNEYTMSWPYRNDKGAIIRTDKAIVKMDSHGYPTQIRKIDREDNTEYWENSYDDNGNLVRRVHYEIRDTGKYYDRGFIIEYEIITE